MELETEQFWKYIRNTVKFWNLAREKDGEDSCNDSVKNEVF